MRTSGLKNSVLALTVGVGVAAAGCRSAQQHRKEADRAAAQIIKDKQQQALGKVEPFTIERPAETLRRRLLLGQELPFTGPASLGTQALEPIKHWPRSEDYLKTAGQEETPALPAYRQGPLRLGLLDALTVGAHNSNDYQARKEQVYLSALDLDLERDEFRTSFFALVNGSVTADLGGDELVSGAVASPEIGLTQRFRNGLAVTTRLGLDLVRLLTQDQGSVMGIFSDTTITLPLLRGAGAHIVAEPLTQAERDVVYAIFDFEQFKREYAVQVASQYLNVLQQFDQVQNSEASYRRLILSARRSRSMANAGRLPELQVDQAVQEELRARDRWIQAQQQYAVGLDRLKTVLGLPTDAVIELDRNELALLAERAQQVLQAVAVPTPTTQPDVPPDDPRRLNGLPGPNGVPGRDVPIPGPQTRPATAPVQGLVPGGTPGIPERVPGSDEPAVPTRELAPSTQLVTTTQPAGATTRMAEGPAGPMPTTQSIELEPPSQRGAGPYELPEQFAVELALDNRPDLRIAQGEVYDAQRRVVVAADALRAGLDVSAGASFGERRGLGSALGADADLRPERGSYSGSARLDLPLERTAERNAYRRSLIALEQATRRLQDLEDQVKLDIRSALRDLQRARESVMTQAKSVAVARRRVDSTDLLLLAGRAQVRDVLESQNSLVTAQNQFSGALVDYRITELELQRDMGLLEVNHEGLWQEWQPPVPGANGAAPNGQARNRPAVAPANGPVPQGRQNQQG